MLFIFTITNLKNCACTVVHVLKSNFIFNFQRFRSWQRLGKDHINWGNQSGRIRKRLCWSGYKVRFFSGIIRGHYVFGGGGYRIRNIYSQPPFWQRKQIFSQKIVHIKVSTILFSETQLCRKLETLEKYLKLVCPKLFYLIQWKITYYWSQAIFNKTFCTNSWLFIALLVLII